MHDDNLILYRGIRCLLVGRLAWSTGESEDIALYFCCLEGTLPTSVLYLPYFIFIVP